MPGKWIDWLPERMAASPSCPFQARSSCFHYGPDPLPLATFTGFSYREFLSHCGVTGEPLLTCDTCPDLLRLSEIWAVGELDGGGGLPAGQNTTELGLLF